MTDLTLRHRDGTILAPDALTTALDTVQISAPGYLTETVALKNTEPKITVSMQRCSIDLVVRTTPPGAKAGGLGPWGRGPWS